MVALSEEASQGLISTVGDRHVLKGDLTTGYSTDWTGRFGGSCAAVVRPADTGEVAAVVALCRTHNIAVIAQGGNTGLVGGGVPRPDPHGRPTVIMSLQRLGTLEPPDTGARAITAGAGVTIGEVDDAAHRVGLTYGVDLASRASATVGGTIATNAGGIHVIRWGATRTQLLGIEAVLGNGSVVRHLGGLIKDNTGYDLAGLLCGSEGTLGIVTAARLRLVAPDTHQTVALAGFDSTHAAIDAAANWATRVPGVSAIEVFLQSGLELVCSHRRISTPFHGASVAYVLVESGGATDPTEDLAAVMAGAAGMTDVAVGRTAHERARLWAYREAHTEAIAAEATATTGVTHKLDVSLPHSRLARFIDTVPHTVAKVAPDARIWLFGHAGDGNIHVNVTGVEPGALSENQPDDAVLTLVASLGGSISAEHGIGVAKMPWLDLNRTPAEQAAFASIKAALDPGGILNPGVVVPT